jgi:regulator of protease activity HflC (stomatin/prohibitin superfamily)
MWPDQSQMRLSSVGMSLFVISVAAGGGAMAATGSRAALVAGALVGFFFLFSIRIADQWEKVAVLRFGRFTGLRGPGLFFMIPIVDRLSRYVDQRVRVANVSAESTLTRDTVPVNVDAIVFWLVWNAEKSILEVQDFTQAITLSAQTALRESIGRTISKRWRDSGSIPALARFRHPSMVR